MQIYFKTKKHLFRWNYKKFIKNIAIAGTIAIHIIAYIMLFIQYNNYIYSLMK